MSIHRIGPTAEPYIQDLGRVLVTLDDLKALMDLLSATVPEEPELHVAFNGGYFTDAEDLRRLSDNEIRSLRISTSQLQVILDPVQCYAVGDEITAKNVYRLWARSRQLLPSRWSDDKHAKIDRVLMIAGFITAGILATLVWNGFGITSPVFILASIPPVVIAVTSIALSKIASTPEVHIEVIPFTLQEYRSAQVNNKWPRAAVIVSIVSAGIAIVAIAAPILFTLLTT